MEIVPLTILGSTAVLPLTKGRHATIDASDWPLVAGAKWCLWSGYAAKGLPGGGRLALHRMLMTAKDGEQVDHANRNRLDNRRCNLRLCTPQQNMANREGHSSCGFIGVTGDRGRWKAHIEANGRHYALGRHATPEVAAKIRDAAARHFFGEFAYLNFPDSAGDPGKLPDGNKLERQRAAMRVRRKCPTCGREFAAAGLGRHAKRCAMSRMRPRAAVK